MMQTNTFMDHNCIIFAYTQHSHGIVSCTNKHMQHQRQLQQKRDLNNKHKLATGFTKSTRTYWPLLKMTNSRVRYLANGKYKK